MGVKLLMWIAVVFVLILGVSTQAGTGQITLDSVDGLWSTSTDSILVDQEIKFFIRVLNDAFDTLGFADDIGGISNGFRIYSPSNPSVNWTTISGTNTGALTAVEMDGGVNIVINTPPGGSPHGSGADTVGYGAFAIFGSGMAAGFDSVVLEITFGPISSSFEGDTLCIDSTWFPVAIWKWGGFTGRDFDPEGVFPTWGGPYCFTITCGSDPDLDGVGWNCDNCPTDYNPLQEDADADGIGDSCDTCTDTDGDGFGDPGFPANTCPDDNCPDRFNPLQEDRDNNGIGDSCDVGTGQVTLDSVDGLWGTSTDSILVDQEIKFYIRMLNDAFDTLGFADDIGGVSNGFRIYSPSNPSVDWTTVSGTNTGALTSGEMDGGLFVSTNPPGGTPNGSGADTVGYGGFAIFGSGMAAGFDSVVLEITFGPINSSFDGDTLCIDSTWYPVAIWKWGGFTGRDFDPEGVFPTWGGPYCFTITCGSDADLDGVGWNCDNCPTDYNPLQEDADADGIGDSCDTCTDTDGDGFGDPGFPANTCPEDNCPSTFNALQVDSDSDGVGDVCDTCTDIDNDGFGDPGFPNNTCATDNCPSVWNPSQTDADGDGLGDSCDIGKADFSADVRCGTATLVVQFTDISILVPGRTVTSWQWDFGDGDTASVQNPSHSYTIVGVFDVTLVISDGIFVDTVEKLSFISSQNTVSADLFAFPTHGKAPLTVIFNSDIDGIATEYFWDFGDSDTSDQANPIHVYSSPGVYDVKLRINLSLDGCSEVDSIIKTGYVIVDELEADFGADPVAGAASLNVQFTDSSSGTPVSWNWQFGDGDSSTVQNPSHDYARPDLYDVTLRVTSALSEDTLTRLGYIRVDTAGVADMELTAVVGHGKQTGWGNPNSCFNYNYWVYWTNIGSAVAENCTLKIWIPTLSSGEPGQTFDVSYVTIDTSDVVPGSGVLGPVTINFDTLVMSLGDINPSSRWPHGGGRLFFRVDINCWLPEGYPLAMKAFVTTTSAEDDTTNNQQELIEPIKGASKDGGEFASKTVSPPQGFGAKGVDIGQPITFTVFYNTKAKAILDTVTLIIVDTLDIDLDWSTLMFGDISHPDDCILSFDPITGELVANCVDAVLTNDFVPQLYFTYTVQPSSVPMGDSVIVNNAWTRTDEDETYTQSGQVTVEVTPSNCCINGNSGNITNDPEDQIDISDLTYLVSYMFGGGPEPLCLDEANVNSSSDGEINIADLTFLVAYMFGGGQAPGSCI